MPISPDTSWILQCCQDSLELTCDVGAWPWIANFDLNGFVDGREEQKLPISGLAPALRREFLEWWPSSRDEHRLTLLMMLVRNTPNQIDYVCQTLSDDTLRPFVESGREPPRNDDLMAVLADQLEGDAVICEWTRQLYESLNLPMGDLGNEHFDYLRQNTAVIPIADSNREMLIPLARVGVPRNEIRRVSKVNSAENRRVVKRSMALLGSVIGLDRVREFLSGRKIIINGVLFDYRVSKKSNILRHSADPDDNHVPYELEILDKTGTLLCQGCAVFDNTPVLDQIAALALYMQGGEEIEFLEKCNFFDRREPFASNEYMREISPKSVLEFDRALQNGDAEIEEQCRYMESQLRPWRPITRPWIQNLVMSKLSPDGNRYELLEVITGVREL